MLPRLVQVSTHLTRPLRVCRLRDCGKARDEHEQRTDTLAGQAEDAADAREDR
jgi:hypothetical protein